MTLKIGLTIPKYYLYEQNKYNNGINQNIIFIKKMFEKNHECFFVTDHFEKVTNKKGVLSVYDIESLMDLDYLILGSLIGDVLLTDNLFKNVKIISWHLGNDFENDIPKLLFNKQPGPLIESSCNKYYEIWISPHFGYIIDYYKYN